MIKLNMRGMTDERRETKRLFCFLVMVVMCIFSSIVLLPSSIVYSAVPHLLNYQGRLTDSSGNPLNGSYALTFRIYDAETAGNLLWEEAQANVTIQKGIFSILLGSVTALNLPFDKQYFLEIKVGNEVMSPRQRISSAGYAIRAETAEATEKIKANANDTAPGYIADKVDNTTVEVNASNKIQVKDSGITANKMAAGAGWRSSGATLINNQIGLSGYTDIDLSNYVGANKALVFLKVYNHHGEAAEVSVRSNGETWNYNTISDPLDAGCARLYIGGGYAGTMLVETDQNGIIEWRCPNRNVTIVLIGYIK